MNINDKILNDPKIKEYREKRKSMFRRVIDKNEALKQIIKYSTRVISFREWWEKMFGKDTSVIPSGLYCYDKNGVCPYWSLLENGCPGNGFCSYLGRSDDDAGDGEFSLLWDQVKECEINK